MKASFQHPYKGHATAFVSIVTYISDLGLEWEGKENDNSVKPVKDIFLIWYSLLASVNNILILLHPPVIISKIDVLENLR